LFGIHILLICFSCFFYLLILRKRGRLRNNKVGVNIPEVKATDSAFKMTNNQFGNIWIGEPQSNDTADQYHQRQHPINKEVSFEL
jgi:hypothetical protein